LFEILGAMEEFIPSIKSDLWNSHKSNVSKLEGYDIGALANSTCLIFCEKKYKGSLFDYLMKFVIQMLL
jgi:hypothetical protein